MEEVKAPLVLPVSSRTSQDQRWCSQRMSGVVIARNPSIPFTRYKASGNHAPFLWRQWTQTLSVQLYHAPSARWQQQLNSSAETRQDDCKLTHSTFRSLHILCIMALLQSQIVILLCNTDHY